MQRTWTWMVVAVGMLAGACAAPAAPGVDTAAEEQEIRAISAEWLAFTSTQNAAGIAALFAEDGRIIWAGQDPVVGRTAIQDFLTRDFEASPGRTSNWSPDQVRVAASGDLAVEYGSYSSANAEGAVVEEGNYATVYRREGETWRILSDSSVPSALPESAAN